MYYDCSWFISYFNWIVVPQETEKIETRLALSCKYVMHLYACLCIKFFICYINFAETIIYDEPSLPADPMHQLQDPNRTCIEMMDNHSYNMAANFPVFNLNECPAYVNRDNSGL